MRLTTLLILFSICSIGFSQTQAEMTQQANDSYRKSDRELNEVFKKILIIYKSDSVFIKNSRASQRTWIAFRDAELKMKYPDREAGYYGSVLPMCIAIYLEQLTMGL